jgi:HSP20 family protein
MTNEMSRQPSETPEDGGRIDDPPVEISVFTPPIDIYETDEGLVLRADLPGVTIDTLELQVQDNRLTLFGRVLQTAPKDGKLLHQEYEEGDFLRSFILSDQVDHDRISAKLSNGVLELVLPKAEQPEPRRIQVRSD